MLGNDGAPGGGEASVCQKCLSKTFVWWKMTTSLAKILLSLFSIWGNSLKNFQDFSEHRVVSVRKKPFLEVSLRQDGSKRIWWPFHRSNKPSSAQAAKVEETALRTTFCPAAPDSHGILFTVLGSGIADPNQSVKVFLLKVHEFSKVSIGLWWVQSIFLHVSCGFWITRRSPNHRSKIPWGIFHDWGPLAVWLISWVSCDAVDTPQATTGHLKRRCHRLSQRL